MDTPLLKRLREHLGSITKSQFEKEWKEIEDMGFGDNCMSIDEFAASLMWTPCLLICREKIITGMSKWIQDYPSTSLSFGLANKIYNKDFDNQLIKLIDKMNVTDNEKQFLFTELKKYYKS